MTKHAIHHSKSKGPIKKLEKAVARIKKEMPQIQLGYNQYSYAVASASTTPTAASLVDIQQGTDVGQRLGDTIKCLRMRVNWRAQNNDVTAGRNYRFVIYRDMSTISGAGYNPAAMFLNPLGPGKTFADLDFTEAVRMKGKGGPAMKSVSKQNPIHIIYDSGNKYLNAKNAANGLECDLSAFRLDKTIDLRGANISFSGIGTGTEGAGCLFLTSLFCARQFTLIRKHLIVSPRRWPTSVPC